MDRYLYMRILMLDGSWAPRRRVKEFSEHSWGFSYETFDRSETITAVRRIPWSQVAAVETILLGREMTSDEKVEDDLGKRGLVS